ncbi:hypothetical protein D0T51_09410 [Parabacteroides sp. 52]|uniref:hypothetical protein n=1 Tax=unclassified Parabacteroides TaxID=2649774 RepID=UPI0013D5594B|nr:MULTISPECIES: hypothetical protein [unclassified Parabacteroides]MDH6535478.1 hypothetical protein [Parabacteroides sp. PM5-20]NDV55942.1 hypothetical protein [Parabacteroides sp. 52]
MLTTLLFTVIILVICVVLLAIQVIVKKGGKFPNTHVGGNKALREKGIYCAKTQHREAMKQKGLFERMNEIN